MRKIVAIIAFTMFLAVGFFAFNSYIYTQKQQGGNVDRYTATLSGEYVCLPHRDTRGPQTLECAFGMKTDVGEYYALDLNSLSIKPDLKTGKKFTATGIITPVEMLSTDYWQKYAIEGIFSVSYINQ